MRLSARGSLSLSNARQLCILSDGEVEACRCMVAIRNNEHCLTGACNEVQHM